MLNNRIVPLGSLTAAEKDCMYSLLTEHFRNCCRRQFEDDLREKEGVILLCNEQGAIRGFSTYMFYTVDFDQQQVEIIFSGDTIIHRREWGDSSLFKGFLTVLLEKMAALEGRKFYWFLISKGIRTYLIMPLFFRTFYPCYCEPSPPSVARLLHMLAEQKFGGDYNRETGTILSHGDYLCGELARIPENRCHNPHVHFFMERNPHWQRGDELACITEVGYHNFKDIVKRLKAAVTAG